MSTPCETARPRPALEKGLEAEHRTPTCATCRYHLPRRPLTLLQECPFPCPSRPCHQRYVTITTRPATSPRRAVYCLKHTEHQQRESVAENVHYCLRHQQILHLTRILVCPRHLRLLLTSLALTSTFCTKTASRPAVSDVICLTGIQSAFRNVIDKQLIFYMTSLIDGQLMVR
jgi:hypothetical protein